MSEQEKPQPGWGVALSYGAYALPAGLMIAPVSQMLGAFYAQVMGVSLAATGMILGVLKIYDIVFNIALGVASDRTRSRYGKRKPWMAAGIPLLAIGMWLLFAPPIAEASPLYLTLALFLYYTGSSLIMIPYYALGAEVPATPYGRARMLGMREATMIAAMIFFGLCPLVAASLGFEVTSRETMLLVLGVLGVLTPPALFALLFKVPDVSSQHDILPKFSIGDVLRDFWDALVRNPAFGRLALAYAIVNFAIFTHQALNLFFISKVLQIEKVFGLALLAQGVLTVLAAPLWIWLARRVELNRLIGGSLAVSSAFTALCYTFLPPGQAGLYLLIQGTGAVMFSGTIVLASAIQATAIDYGVLLTGRERAGTYISANNIVSQIAGALPFVIVFPFLELVGFTATGDNSPDALGWVRFIMIYGVLPFQFLGAWMIWNFPITKAEASAHAAELRARRLAPAADAA